MQEGPREAPYAAGWYPDPGGEHDHRYHNGVAWTADVSTDGQRSVAPVPPSRHTSSGSGTAPLVLGIISLTIGWIPFVAFVGLVVAVVAIVLGARRRHDPRSTGGAIAGMVTGAVGVLFAIGGIWLSIALVSAVSRFEEPGAHDAQITECTAIDGSTRATGTITNRESGTRSYTITVSFDDATNGSTTVDDVEPGASATFTVEEDLRFDELDCRIVDVNGPRPFGLDLDQSG